MNKLQFNQICQRLDIQHFGGAYERFQNFFALSIRGRDMNPAQLYTAYVAAVNHAADCGTPNFRKIMMGDFIANMENVLMDDPAALREVRIFHENLQREVDNTV